MKRLSFAGVVVVLIAAFVFLARASSVSVSAPGGGHSGRDDRDNFSFGPATLTVAAGTKVIWTNRDDIPRYRRQHGGRVQVRRWIPDEKFSYVCQTGNLFLLCSVHRR